MYEGLFRAPLVGEVFLSEPTSANVRLRRLFTMVVGAEDLSVFKLYPCTVAVVAQHIHARVVFELQKTRLSRQTLSGRIDHRASPRCQGYVPHCVIVSPGAGSTLR